MCAVEGQSGMRVPFVVADVYLALELNEDHAGRVPEKMDYALRVS